MWLLPVPSSSPFLFLEEAYDMRLWPFRGNNLQHSSRADPRGQGSKAREKDLVVWLAESPCPSLLGTEAVDSPCFPSGSQF